MPRRRYYYRFRRTKQKWSVVTFNLNETYTSLPTNTFSIGGHPIVGNLPPQGTTTAAPIIKTGRFRVKGCLSANTTEGYLAPRSSVIFALMFIPQGTEIAKIHEDIANVNDCVFYLHPEWILGWTRFDYTNPAQRNEFSITSRLKRNLNRGDSIQLVCLSTNYSQATQSGGFSFSATVSYVCRAN